MAGDKQGKRRVSKWRWGLALGVVALLGVLLLEAWPFLTYPKTTLSFQLTEPARVDAPGHLQAGVAVRDITPPPGLPKFGYSTFAADADGFRTRLKARAIYLHAPGSTPLALVQLDLGAGSLILHKRVAELIAQHTNVPAHGLSLLVTHTHTGPGNFLDSDFYNVFGSNRAGFDEPLFDFLAAQIADALIDAYQHRRDARVATGQQDAWGLTRNRSLAAWARNHGLDPDTLPGDAVFRAVNPRMTMLRIDQRADDGCFHPAAALTSFSVHGTAIPAFTAPYHGDVWAGLARNIRVDQRPAGDACGANPFAFVHAPFQATHGDNNPDVRAGQRGHMEATRIGNALAAHASALHASLAGELRADISTQVASRELALLELSSADRFGLCERAIVGAATAGAANDDEVFPVSYLPFLQEGWPRRFFSDGCHGVKQWMLSKLQLLLPAERFPHRALLQVIRIDDLAWVALPWEVTLEAGNRIRSEVSEALGPDVARVEISSLANGYMGYAVTAEEYGAQYYEGGHTLYGPGTVPFLAGQSARLAADLGDKPFLADLPAESRFELVTRSHWPTVAQAASAPGFLDAPVFHAAEVNQQPYWSAQVQAEAAAVVALHQPLIAVEHWHDGQWRTLVDDQGMDLQLLTGDQPGRWQLRWFEPDHQGRYRFRVESRGEREALYSSPFPASASEAVSQQ